MEKMILTFGLSILFSGGFAQSNWPDYRGNRVNGTSSQILPLKWSDSTGIAWKVDVPGQGWSSPIIMDGKIWITSAEKNGLELFLLAYEVESGNRLHKILIFQKDSVQKQHPLNSFASPSVAIEKDRVYAHFGAYGTAAVDANSGKVIWKRTDLHCDHEVGPGSSPILYRNHLIFNMDGTDVQFVIALNKHTGKTAWKKHRGMDFSHLRFDEKKAFYTPILHKIKGKDVLINPGPHAVMAYEPETGKELWKVAYQGFSGSARPLIHENLLYINTGFGMSAVVCIDLPDTPQDAPHVLWTQKRSMQARSSPLIVNGNYLMINTGGTAKLLNPVDGSILSSEKVGGQTSASPILANGIVYTFDQDGLCTLFRAGQSFIKLGENKLEEGLMASPAVSNNSLIIRTKSRLYRIIGSD